MAAMKGLPWPLTFSYSRALQNPALKTWRGQAGNVAAAQKAFHHRAHMNGARGAGQVDAPTSRSRPAMTMALYESKIKSLPRLGKGKVRDIYAVDDRPHADRDDRSAVSF